MFFLQRHMQRLRGRIGIGHVRYPTAGSDGPALVQPHLCQLPLRHRVSPTTAT